MNNKHWFLALVIMLVVVFTISYKETKEPVHAQTSPTPTPTLTPDEENWQNWLIYQSDLIADKTADQIYQQHFMPIEIAANNLATTAQINRSAAVEFNLMINQLKAALVAANNPTDDEAFKQRACIEIVDKLTEVPDINLTGAINAWSHFGC